jgi:hypothetical protein
VILLLKSILLKRMPLTILITSDGVNGELMDNQIEYVFFRENFYKNEIYEMLLKRLKVLEGRQDDQSVLIKWV